MQTVLDLGALDAHMPSDVGKLSTGIVRNFILGYDHIEEEDEKIMFSIQEAILNKAKLKRGE